MTPGALVEDTVPRDGAQLEETSDNIDAVNVLKDQRKKEAENAFNEASEFDSEKDKTQFRQYEDACDRVKNFYYEQHTKQTVAYNLKARNDFKTREKHRMTVWEAIEKLNTLIDESDPDNSLPQISHLLQSAEAIRRDGKPRWMQLTGLIHDLGKLLFFYGSQGQWDVVGDTFPVGCRFDERIIYPGSFEANPDSKDPIYSTKDGIYSAGCGLDNIMLSWGHDEYLYHVVKDQSTLPKEALAMIRYHSFYPWHKEGAYRDFMDEHDHDMLEAVKAFNPYDLYSKSDGLPDEEELKVCYKHPTPILTTKNRDTNVGCSPTTSSLSTSTSPTRLSSGRRTGAAVLTCYDKVLKLTATILDIY
jgi:inositol oxygenase